MTSRVELSETDRGLKFGEGPDSSDAESELGEMLASEDQSSADVHSEPGAGSTVDGPVGVSCGSSLVTGITFSEGAALGPKGGLGFTMAPGLGLGLGRGFREKRSARVIGRCPLKCAPAAAGHTADSA